MRTKPPISLAIVTQAALSRTHGTGAQILRILSGSEMDYFHFYFNPYHGHSEVEKSYLLVQPKWQHYGRWIAWKLEKLFRTNWWNGDHLNVPYFRKFMRRRKLNANLAYVFAVDESSAVRTNAVLDALALPYIVHVMDIFEENGLNPEVMPALRKMFGGASCIIALGDAIAEEIEKFNVKNLRKITIGQDDTSHLATSPTSTGRLNLLTVGTLYEAGIRLLAEAWPELKHRFPNLRLIYAGASSRTLLEPFGADLDDRGYVSNREDYEKLVAEGHIAFLSGPLKLDSLGKFSVPSRTCDYIMAGLPVVAAIHEQSATRRFFRPVIPQGINAVLTAKGIIDAVAAVGSDQTNWVRASAVCREFAVNNLSMHQVREEILETMTAVIEMKA